MNIRIIYFFLLALLLTACESQSEKLQKILNRASRLTAFVS